MVEITVDDEHAGLIDASFSVIAHIHARMSFHEPASDLTRLRHAQAEETVEVDAETVTVLRMAIALYRSTAGLFDVGVGRALVRGRFLPRDGIAALDCFSGNTSDIEILGDTHVRIRQPILIDLGGIAKGHAVDRAVELLISKGAGVGLVNAGGDLRMFGNHDWEIQLRDADDVVRRTMTMKNRAIASSANLHNRRRVRGALYTPHIGRDGAPILVDHRVSIIADRCIIADAMTKVAMIDPILADEILVAHNGYVLREELLAGAA